MRKLIASFGAASLLAVVPVFSTPAMAAVIVKGDNCKSTLLNSDGTFDVGGPEYDGSLISRTVKNGTTTLTCHIDVPDSVAPTKAAHARGFDCYIHGLLTNDTRASLSSGGRMVLTCRRRA